MQSDCVLCHLSILVSGRQVTQGTDSRLCDVLSVSSPQHCANQGFNTSNLHKDVLQINAQTRNTGLEIFQHSGENYLSSKPLVGQFNIQN